ncbi:MAG: CpsD/CapB family tyrosine-protein kinase [Erysipelothrix sp.]|nr:CpsD/CapB family tyrosine-protein kinase [Erysipelothrix sp.]
MSRRNQNITHDKSKAFAYKEAYNTLRVNLNFATFGGEVKKILITSSIPSEGKTTISINLASTLAKAGNKVLLIEGDLRKPTFNKYMRVRNRGIVGFSSVLSGQVKVEDVIFKTKSNGFDVIFAGPIPPNPSELLERPNVKDVFDTLEPMYDYIIVDGNPVGVVSDSKLLGRHLDGALFVIRSDFVEKKVSVKALEELQNSGVKVLGGIVNRFDYKDEKHLYYYESDARG